jgi:hypothetical protein
VLDVGVRLPLLPLQVVDADLQVARASVQVPTLRREVAQLGVLGETGEQVAELVGLGVEGLDVEQPQLREGVCSQRLLLGLETTGRVARVARAPVTRGRSTGR